MRHRSKVMMHAFKSRILIVGAIAILTIVFPSSLMGQTRTYTAENVNYALVLPSEQWRAVNVPGIGHDTTEFRYDEDGAVQLRIRRELVDAEVTVEDLIDRQQTLDRSYLPGYVKER